MSLQVQVSFKDKDKIAVIYISLSFADNLYLLYDRKHK